MTWNVGSATNYITLLEELIQIATSDHVATAVVNAGGSGYTVGDILTVAGGTASHVATLRVLTAPAGAVGLLRVETGGAYTVAPTLSGNAVTGGSGAGATVNLTMDFTGWVLRRRSQVAVSATVAAGGTGYGVGNVLTLVGGVLGHGGSAATFTVATLSGSAVATVTLTSAGLYEEIPANPIAVTGGAGSGATLNVTWAFSSSLDQVVILEGEGFGAADAIVVGIKTWQGQNVSASATTFNWALFGMSTYNAALPFHQQPDISPGLQASGAITTSLNVGAFVPLKDADAFDMDFWISATPRRIIGQAKTRTASLTRYMGWHVGFLNQLGTTSEFPYPLYIAGASNRLTVWYQDATAIVSGLSEVLGRTGGNGPAYVWDPNGSWISVRNFSFASDVTLDLQTRDVDNVVYPAGLSANSGTLLPVEDQIVDDGSDFNWDDIIFADGAGALFLFTTPGSQHWLVPCVVLRTDQGTVPDTIVQMGEIDGLFWTSAAEGESAEDEIVNATNERFRMFYNGNRTATYSYLAIRED